MSATLGEIPMSDHEHEQKILSRASNIAFVVLIIVTSIPVAAYAAKIWPVF